LPFGLYAKHGRKIRVTEALATQCVSVNTTIPVPTILDVLVGPAGTPFILMTRISSAPHTANERSDAQLTAFGRYYA